jgi:hypothetical protein
MEELTDGKPTSAIASFSGGNQILSCHGRKLGKDGLEIGKLPSFCM